jgi:hypothetical protein
VITLAGLFTDTLANLERLPPGLRAATTATWTTLAQSSPTLSASELESRLRDAFTSAIVSVSDQERASVQGAMAAIVTQWVKSAPLRRSQALTDPGEALRALTKPFLAIHGARDRDLDAATNLGPLVRYLGAAANADFMVATIPDIDHWMWVCTQPSEPGKPCAEMQFGAPGRRVDRRWRRNAPARVECSSRMPGWCESTRSAKRTTERAFFRANSPRRGCEPALRPRHLTS